MKTESKEWMNEFRYLKHYATVPLLLQCLSVFLSASIPLIHSWWWFFPSVLWLFSLSLALSLLFLWSSLIFNQFYLLAFPSLYFWFKSIFLGPTLSVAISLYWIAFLSCRSSVISSLMTFIPVLRLQSLCNSSVLSCLFSSLF